MSSHPKALSGFEFSNSKVDNKYTFIYSRDVLILYLGTPASPTGGGRKFWLKRTFMKTYTLVTNISAETRPCGRKLQDM